MKTLVSGRALDRSGVGIPGGVVTLWHAVGRDVTNAAETFSGPEGEFSVEAELPDGETWPPTLLASLSLKGRIIPTRPALVVFGSSPTRPRGSIEIIAAESLTPGEHTDVPTLGEFGVAVSKALGEAQSELALYPEANGRFTFSAFEISLPVAVSVDELGRFRVTTDINIPERSGQLRLMIGPEQDRRNPANAGSLIDIAETGLLAEDQIADLRAQRVHDLDQLGNLLARPLTRSVMAPLDLPVQAIADLYTLLVESGLPLPAGRALLKIGIRSVDAFEGADPEALAKRLAESGTESVTRDDILRWQRRVHENIWGRPEPSDEP